ncbi:hypothetical protein HGP17_25410 [Rhizobium sp. P38BS-XIX]|uniref:DNA circularization N-terminal domain-containing protein n=1 Tax=Rhizobium sp. P38BS-XIX TaxID=2726740 RepID=UPI0014565B35|nr:DNA circularization N-terminal domain-containing protein [Rhizobium sp. P38BS-XIX]NLS00177.1 hypothetical protein [Rhizobium sp. P38BS-XIX]
MFDSLDWVLPGLLPGSFRGIPFHVPDASTEVGRRVVEYLFPGVDMPAYDDFGLAPAVVSIEGLIVGDDYVVQAAALEAAFQAPGPATLIHPWRGPMTVIMEQPAQISLSASELRVVRFSAAFKRLPALSLGVSFSSSAGLSSATSAILAAASSAITATTANISAARSKAIARTTRMAVELAGTITAPAGAARTMPRIKAALAATTATDPASFDAQMIAAASIIGLAAPAPAVSPAAEALSESPASALSLMSIGMSFVEGFSTQSASAPSDTDAMLIFGAACHFVGQTAAQSAYADYQSSQQAQAFRGRATTAIDALTDMLEAISAPSLLPAASSLRRAARDLQAALIADINETIGRLPAVLIFRPERPLDSWLLAQHVFGDRPSAIEAAYEDIVGRNRPRHPAALQPGDIEVLR